MRVCVPQRSPQTNRNWCNNVDVISAGITLRAITDAETEAGKNQEQKMSPSTWEPEKSLYICRKSSMSWAPRGKWKTLDWPMNRVTSTVNQDTEEEHRGKDGCLGFVTGKCIWVKAWRVDGLSWWLRWYRICPQCRRPQVQSLGWEDSWRREWQPTTVFLLGEFLGQRSLAGYSPWEHKKLDTTQQLSLFFFFFLRMNKVYFQGKFGLGIQNEAGQRLIEFCQENSLIIANTLFQQHKRRLHSWTSPDGQHQNRLIIFFAAQDGEAL